MGSNGPVAAGQTTCDPCNHYFGQKVESASSGSGFVITQDGYIVTNQHVVSGASSVNVTLYNGDTYPATVVGGDSDYDVAVLKIEASGLQTVTLGDSDQLKVGQAVMAIGMLQRDGLFVALGYALVTATLVWFSVLAIGLLMAGQNISTLFG